MSEVEKLKLEVERLRGLLERSIRAESTGDGWRLVMGEDVEVLVWDGDGVSTDQVRHRTPALQYMVNTTPHIRCLRLLVEGWNWPIACAMVAGPGYGELRPSDEIVDDGIAEEMVRLRRTPDGRNQGLALCVTNGIVRVRVEGGQTKEIGRVGVRGLEAALAAAVPKLAELLGGR